MHLWNDYEGKTLANAFPLEKLLRTEGRSASFATRDQSGRPAVIRLTEALNDQQPMLARFHAVQQLNHPNLVTIEAFGEAEFEGTPLIYLVMEPTEESLADILSDRRLSLEETGEVATSVTGALRAMHAQGLVHGLVEPSSVLAAGEVIKLRSDCVRPLATGPEGDRARAEDILGLAGVLYRSLTQQRLHDASDALALPEPYASIVRNSVRGSWGIEEVASELRRFVRPPAAAQPAALPTPAAVPAGASSIKASSASQPVPSFTDTLGAATRIADLAASAGPAHNDSRSLSSRNADSPGAARTSRAHEGDTQLPLLYAASTPGIAEEDHLATRAMEDAHEPEETREHKSPLYYIAVAAILLILGWLVWHFTHHNPDPRPSTQSAAPAIQPVSAARAVPAPASPPSPGPAPVQPRDAAAASTRNTQVHNGKVWRVVAYTYNQDSQAQAKARLISQRHADLHAEVYSPTGHAPYLVTLGGALSRRQAAEVSHRARTQGLARDVYIQNYSH